MTRKHAFKTVDKAIRQWLLTNPTRQAITMDEFWGGRAATRGHNEPPAPYTGEHLDKVAVAQVFSTLQLEGVLGSPFRPDFGMRDISYPRQFRVRRPPNPPEG